MAHEYKYTLNALIDDLPNRISIDSITNLLAKDYGISRDTFFRHRRISYGSDEAISGDHLEIYAGLFGVSVDRLKTETKKVKSLVERKPSAFIKKVGLKPAKQ